MTEATPRLNRVDPFGDLHRVPERGMFTGNRGCLVDGTREVVRHHRGQLWITCVLSYMDWRSPLDRPGHWTPLFFLDDAVALAAGHRPCGLCRRDDCRAYVDAVQTGLGMSDRPSATDLNWMLAGERLERGRGLSRARDRKTWRVGPNAIPDGTVVVEDSGPRLVVGGMTLEFTFGGWANPKPLTDADLEVLTPPTSVAALSNGFQATLHRSAGVD